VTFAYVPLRKICMRKAREPEGTVVALNCIPLVPARLGSAKPTYW